MCVWVLLTLVELSCQLYMFFLFEIYNNVVSCTTDVIYTVKFSIIISHNIECKI